MTETKTAILSTVLGLILLSGAALYAFSLNTNDEFALSSYESEANTRTSESFAYGAYSTLNNSSNLLGVSVEYKAGVVSALENIQTEQNTTLDTQ
jgi:hypothetical protein